jgi:hypothetical protein
MWLLLLLLLLLLLGFPAAALETCEQATGRC